MFRSRDNRLGWGLVAALGSLPLAALLVLAVVLADQGRAAVPALSDALFSDTLWLPAQDHFGIAFLLAGTFASTMLALLLALPIGFAAALHLALYAGPRTRKIAAAAIALLGSVPSVIIGLWGMTWVTPWVGHSLIAAAVVLALMITPTFTLLAGSALGQVHREVPETVRSLGVGEVMLVAEMMRQARRGLIGALILATSRALGEAVALSMVAGNVPGVPRLMGPVSTLTTTLIVEFDGAVETHRAALYLLAFLVMVLIAGTSLLLRYTRPGLAR